MPYLAARPLIQGVQPSEDVDLLRAPPAELTGLLANGTVDVALLGPAELLQLGTRVWLSPIGGIASIGPALMIRLFGRIPGRRVRTVWAESETLTAAAVVRVLWAMAFKTDLHVIPFRANEVTPPADAEAVVLAGDRVVTDPPMGFDYQTDLARMWHRHTGLPLPFAVWAATDKGMAERVEDVLADARQTEPDERLEIARQFGPSYGWPTDLAERELTQHLDYDVTPALLDGLFEFSDLAKECGLVKGESDRMISLVGG